MQLDILNTKGEKTGRTVELPEEIFGIEPNDHVIYLAVKQFQGAQRQGTHKVKTRMEVHGSSKKLHKQKGTGGARKGNLRNPLYKGGGTIFGPKPHKYDIKLNQKVKTLAKMSALSYKAKDNAITVLEDFSFEAPKTKNYVDLIKNLNLSDKKTLLVLGDANKNVYLSSRNIQGAKVVNASDLNTYDILHAENLILAESSIKVLETILNK